MFVKTIENTILSAANYFKDELIGSYDASELNQMLQITFFHYFNISRVDLTLKSNEKLPEEDFNKIVHVVSELKENKPLAYILGEWEFYGLSLKVNENTLIPRSETEELVQLIIDKHKDDEQLSILDIGTGTGCIPLALKKNLPKANVTAWDISKEALMVASANAKKNGIKVNFNEVDVLEWELQNISEKYDVIVSNPPYILNKERAMMNKNVLDYEPDIALFVDNDNPLLFYNAIANFSLHYLKEDGKLYFEINESYGSEVEALLADKKFKDIYIVKDMNKKDRIVECSLK